MGGHRERMVLISPTAWLSTSCMQWLRKESLASLHSSSLREARRLIKAKALLVNCAMFTIRPLTMCFTLLFMALPAKPSVQVSSFVKAALTQVCMSFIVSPKFDPFS